MGEADAAAANVRVMQALGEKFRTARESQGLSLADVAASIHIRSLYLAAIEAEDWQTIGPAVYVRGFIRSYARFLGLDADAAVAGFGSTPGLGGSSASTVTLATPPRGEPSRSGLPRGQTRKSSSPSVWAVLGLLVAGILVVLVGYQYFQFHSTRLGGGSVPLAQASVGPLQPAGHREEFVRSAGRSGAAALSRPAKIAAKASGFAVTLKDSSWLRVIVDGKVAMEGSFPAGTARSFSGRSVTVRVGNAGGVDVTVNGKHLGPLGGLGDVAERSFQL